MLTLPPGGSHVAETTLEVLSTPDEVARVEAEIKGLQGRATPTLHKAPVEPFAKEG